MFQKIFFARLKTCFCVVAALVIFGTGGYIAIEGWSPLDGFYMTIITMSTVGFAETRELSNVGRLFTMALIFMSISGMSVWTASVTSLFVGGDLSGVFLERKLRRMIKKLKNHTIICGSGTMAQTILECLIKQQMPVVVVDDDSDQVERLRRIYPQLPVLNKSPTCELALAEANVFCARHVVAALESEFDNLLIAMTCSEIGKSVRIFARADDNAVASRLQKAGANEVVCPYQLSGKYVAEQICA